MVSDSARRAMLRAAVLLSLHAGPLACVEEGGEEPLRLGRSGPAEPSATAEEGTTPKSVPAGFTVEPVFTGLALPTVVRFSPDGRVFVAEKRGTVKVYDSLADTTATVIIDVTDEVYSYWDRGLLGMALHPRFPAEPYLYLLYTLEVEDYGDDCADPTGSGCIANGRLSKIRLDADGSTAVEAMLSGNWCQQYPSHSIGSLEFGADGALYVSAGDGASFNFADEGQAGNPCGDPAREGGALRSQDLRTSSDPLTFDGAILRVSPDTLEALPTNPLSGGDPGDDRVVAIGFRNPFRFTVRPGTSELWIGDVGWNTWEEIDRVVDPTASPIRNFGWPCYEGSGRQPGYDGLNNPICEALYLSPGAVTPPVLAYQHGVPMDGCPEQPGSTSAITGLAFYEGGDYPVSYDRALFFADLARACIWVMLPGPDGVPSASNVELFAKAEPSVGLVKGPNNDIFSVDHYGGVIERFVYANPGNRAPTAVAEASPTSGLAPLDVQFDGSGSTDPDGDALAYAWDLDADGQRDDSTIPTPAFTYGAPGTYVVSLEVSDGRGGTAVDQVTISVGNEAPVATIDAPTTSTAWSVGERIAFSGHGTDSGEQLDPSRLRWSLDLQHCAPNVPTDCHTHHVQDFVGVDSGSFVAPDHDYPAHLTLTLTVTDAFGLSDSETVRLDPRTVALTFETDPGGLELVVGGAAAETSPFTRTVIVGSTHSVSAASPQTLGGVTYDFVSWSDGGAQAHDVVAPATASTYRATYEARVEPPSNAPPTAVATAAPTSGRAPLTVAFDGSGSTDPDGDTLVFRWDLTGDGVFDATGPTPTWTYTTAGARTVTLEVDDGRGATDTASLKIRVQGARGRN